MQLFVGLTALRGKIKGFPLDLLELQVTSNLPRPKTLRDFVAARPDLSFRLRLPIAIFDKNAVTVDSETIKIAADSLAASFIVIPTGPRFTPTKRNQQRLQALAEALRVEGRVIAWEPHGVWSDQELKRWSAELDVEIVRDVMKEKPIGGDFLYTRLRAFGTSSRLSEVALERLVNLFEGYKRVVLIVDGEGAQKTRSLLKSYLDEGESELLEDELGAMAELTNEEAN